jgi:hypothetical protein
MQRQSESIAALAAALAKAQIEIENPEKSLVGSIEAKDQNAPERVFRYAEDTIASFTTMAMKPLGGRRSRSSRSRRPGRSGLRHIRNWWRVRRVCVRQQNELPGKTSAIRAGRPRKRPARTAKSPHYETKPIWLADTNDIAQAD